MQTVTEERHARSVPKWLKFMLWKLIRKYLLALCCALNVEFTFWLWSFLLCRIFLYLNSYLELPQTTNYLPTLRNSSSFLTIHITSGLLRDSHRALPKMWSSNSIPRSHGTLSNGLYCEQHHCPHNYCHHCHRCHHQWFHSTGGLYVVFLT